MDVYIMCLHIIFNRYRREKLQSIHNMFGYKMDFIYMSTSDISNHISSVWFVTRQKYSEVVSVYL